jgi:hypothetical protein
MLVKVLKCEQIPLLDRDENQPKEPLDSILFNMPSWPVWLLVLSAEVISLLLLSVIWYFSSGSYHTLSFFFFALSSIGGSCQR